MDLFRYRNNLPDIKTKATMNFDLAKSSQEVGQSAYKMEKYKQAVQVATKNLLEEYQRHKLSPEKHPMYSEDWIKFWERRYKALKKEGKVNPDDYDYTKEWKVVWKARMKEILDESIEAEKKKIRIKLNLQRDYEVVKEDNAKKRSRSGIFEVLSSDEDSVKNHSIRQIEYDEINSDESSGDSFCDRKRRHSYPEKRLRLESPRSYQSTPSRPQTSSSFDDLSYYNDDVSLITVFRLLSALETELGCLSHKVLDLLSKAISLEKVKPNSSDEILMTSDNVVFLETVKEKLKGLLIVGVLPPPKLSAVKRCIQNIAKLIHLNPVRESKPLQMPTVDPQDPSEMDEKAKLAKEISEALKACGKENCSPEELEVLVEIYLENEQEESAEQSNNEEMTAKVTPSHNDMASLTDEDLKVLLTNFVDLKNDEQDLMINFLSEMENTDHARVESLRKYVKFNCPTNSIEDDSDDDYNIDEAVINVVQNLEPSVEDHHQNCFVNNDDSSLTDNLLTFGILQNRHFN